MRAFSNATLPSDSGGSGLLSLDAASARPVPGQWDVYVTAHANAFGWGGARSFGVGFDAALAARGLRTRSLVIASQSPAKDVQADTAYIRLGPLPLLWRVGDWLLPQRLTRALRTLPPPRKAFVGMTMFSVLAAKRAWRGTRVVYRLPCLLTNALPFDWPTGEPETLWQRLQYEAIRRAERAALEAADGIVVATEAARAEAAALYAAARAKTSVCPYGPPAGEVNQTVRDTVRRHLGAGRDAVVCVLAGVCDRNKAFELAVGQWPVTDTRAHLVVVGHGPAHDALAARAADSAATERIHLVGAQPDMSPWYSAADVVLSTSRYDMYPNTVQEATALGRPVVVPRHDPPRVFAGAAELVTQEGCGLVYERESDGSLAVTINRLVRDDVLRRHLGQQARRAAERRAGYDTCVAAALGEAVAAVDAAR
jgi:glycosyltransferase involved in cell wall biosynthesis